VLGNVEDLMLAARRLRYLRRKVGDWHKCQDKE
jgi:hypothetical protein